ncbi:Vesicular integral-membrane protein VIP36, partial [Mortierella sp. NVP85]
FSFPYVMAMIGDGRTSYNAAQDGVGNSVASCEADFRGKSVPTKARISLYRDTKVLVLKLQTKAWDQWDDCFTLTDVDVPLMAYLGFTAVTGEVHDNHDIISVTTTTLGKSTNDYK